MKLDLRGKTISIKKSGGLNCIKLTSFFKSIKLNWVKRYAILGYDDFWTSLLDSYLKINKNNRKQILNWGAGEFNNPIKNCRNKFLKHILITLQEFISIFVTKPEYGDNRFICQPLFKNNNLKHQWRNKYIVF